MKIDDTRIQKRSSLEESSYKTRVIDFHFSAYEANWLMGLAYGSLMIIF